MMTNCDEIREHLETCEDCRLYVAVEARLRGLPVLEPPPGLVQRCLKSLPRPVPFRRELLRLTAAAVLLIGLVAGLLSSPLPTNARVASVRAEATEVWRSTLASMNAWRADAWWR
jgi:hypothetical protein